MVGEFLETLVFPSHAPFYSTFRYETTEDYFPSDKALRIRELVLEQLEQDETAHMLLRAIATTDENNLSKMHKIDGIMRAIGTSVLIDLTMPSEEGAASKMSIPYLGTERTAWDSFETVYKVISVADQTGVLSEAKLKEWSCILRIMFDTDEYVVRKASLSEESALALANAYRDYSLSTQFQEELTQELEEISVAKDRMNQSALALEVYDRQRVLMRVVSRFLDEIYSHFGYTGTEGFILMQKALNEHIQNADVVAALAEAGANVAHTAGLQQ